MPVLEWLDELLTKVKAKCTERIDRLGEVGHELRRPEADFLRDGIYELRASYQGVHYRMLYILCRKGRGRRLSWPDERARSSTPRD